MGVAAAPLWFDVAAIQQQEQVTASVFLAVGQSEHELVPPPWRPSQQGAMSATSSPHPHPTLFNLARPLTSDRCRVMTVQGCSWVEVESQSCSHDTSRCRSEGVRFLLRSWSSYFLKTSLEAAGLCQICHIAGITILSDPIQKDLI